MRSQALSSKHVELEDNEEVEDAANLGKLI